MLLKCTSMISLKRLIGALLLCLVSSVSISVLLALSSMSSSSCPCQDGASEELSDGDDPTWGEHRLAVIVPFRDRYPELLQFAPHLHKFLNNQRIRHKIYILNQVDKLRFNRASLINVGHLLSRRDCDYLAMHDVDLLPLNPQLSYSYPSNGPFHVAAPQLHPKYHYSTFVGGILLLTREHFEKLNGLSNKYWGWGLEDDEFYARMKEAKLNVTRPQGITTGTHNTFRHLHDQHSRKRDTARLFNQKEATRRRDRKTGLNTVQFQLISTQHISVDSAPLIFHNIKLICNHTVTPWCEHKAMTSTTKKVT